MTSALHPAALKAEVHMSLTMSKQGVYHWRKTIDGHPFFKSTKTDDLKLAQQMAALWEADAIREVFVVGNKPMGLHAVIKAFLDERKGKPGWQSAKGHLGHFLSLPNEKFSDVHEHAVLEVIEKRREAGVAHNTLSVMSSYWLALVRFAESKKWSTCPKIERIKPEKTRLRYLTKEEEAGVFAAIDPNAKYPGKCLRTDRARQTNCDLVTMLLDTGARYREMAQMKWSQVSFAQSTVLIYRPKGGTDTTIVMTDRMKATLTRRKLEASDEWVFPTKRKHNNAYKWMKAACARAGIDVNLGKVTLHTRRHTNATRLLQGGLNIVEVQVQLGHASLQSTMVYLHVTPMAAAEKAAGILNKPAA
ncbi:integrase [Acidovorax soli]|uniref:Integrase n=1 Tax=Acidovorax soli TaxID=592050 RepID=A0A7X0PHR7_9BURK|nr:site-specific integrase [Acidovorax soli]MBB6561984.1 integrase [Acidovorax soli]